jgi:hypothetical protein
MATQRRPTSIQREIQAPMRLYSIDSEQEVKKWFANEEAAGLAQEVFME